MSAELQAKLDEAMKIEDPTARAAAVNAALSSATPPPPPVPPRAPSAPADVNGALDALAAEAASLRARIDTLEEHMAKILSASPATSTPPTGAA